MLENAYNALKSAGLDARLAADHSGVCTAPYCVAYEGQEESGKTVNKRHVIVDVLVPAEKPGWLPGEVRKVRAALQAADFRPSFTSPTTVLEDYKAVTASVDFVMLCGN